ncbi:MAG: cob(I)yrinic acid a,c-diamide adenosyltransferase [Victivallales bacterium]|nr:cob(I)yrinic acid a,c-diamide adenosyltransferase [Victivallales bacterium]
MLFEKQNERGLLLNITGNGKGKTTSGLGACVRALGWNWKVCIIQFIKSSRVTGEKKFAELISQYVDLEIYQTGYGATWKGRGTEPEHIEAAQQAWAQTKEYIAAGKVDLLMLDELNIALSFGWLDADDVIKTFKNRPASMNIIVTGRNAPDWLLEISDLVSEIKEIKHPLKKGIPARKGIEF